jgi:hypothetical protein
MQLSGSCNWHKHSPHMLDDWELPVLSYTDSNSIKHSENADFCMG